LAHLSPRAQAYLDGLQRVAVPDVREVEQQLRQELPHVPAAWLAFHERYGGFVQPLGEDRAILGLMFTEGTWVVPNACGLELDDPRDPIVMCADVHPTYSYYLDQDGKFLGDPSDNFEVYLERCALYVAFKSVKPGRVVHIPNKDLSDATMEQVRQVMQHGRVAEASDSYKTMYEAESMLITSHEAGSLMVLVRVDI
jgi:hypothetical protein